VGKLLVPWHSLHAFQAGNPSKWEMREEGKTVLYGTILESNYFNV
jgi:hypothetical protein